ncbi:GTP pyrophosphokinase family protein [Fructilactobacillus cliffordii]|uniref:GTP pyrophosphokinase n=1 Tax=Fructilactobacillus cliffordii TaxID=2940299 RepID=UPI002093CA24|nr:GTP pyrophosphokinase family protein [Fructilactobacillus cliffordii]USS86378.1 GTP pyrophosphokinase family protein [Fructilactobacillus cliffordii]
MNENWGQLLFPYQQAAKEWKVKLRGMRKEFQVRGEHSPIEFVTSRIKSIPSIEEKMQRRHITADRLTEDMEDLCGLRIMCPFLDDVSDVVQLLRRRNDVEIVSERDYVNNEKESGYRSYHIVFRYPLQLLDGEREILVEIQVRTLAMNFWATLEHSLNYKHPGEFPEDVHKRLQAASETAFKLDEEMSQIHHELSTSEAQQNQANKGEK